MTSPECCVACGTIIEIDRMNVYRGEKHFGKFVRLLQLGGSELDNLDQNSVAFCRQCKSGLRGWSDNQVKISKLNDQIAELNAEVAELTVQGDESREKFVSRILRHDEESQTVQTRNSGRKSTKGQNKRATGGREAFTRVRNFVCRKYGNKVKDGKLVKESDGGRSVNRPIKREAEEDDDGEKDRPRPSKRFNRDIPFRMDCGVQTVWGKPKPKETQTETVSLDSTSTQTKGFQGVDSSSQTVVAQKDRGIQVKTGSQVSDGTQTEHVKLSETGIQTTENRVNESVTTVAIIAGGGGTPQSASTPNRRSLIKEVGPGKFIFQDKIPFEKIQGIYKCGACSSILSCLVVDVVKHIRQNHFEDLVKYESTECVKPVVLPYNPADNNQEIKHTENNSSMAIVEPPCINVPLANVPANQSTVVTLETNQPAQVTPPPATKKEIKKFIYRNQPFDFKDGQFTCTVCSNNFPGDIASAKKYILQHMRTFHQTNKVVPSRPANITSGLVPRSSEGSVSNTTLKRTGLSTFRYRDKVSFKFVRSSFVCSLCPAGEGTFYTKSGMIQHIKRKHEEESWDQCVETREEMSTKPVVDEENCMIVEPYGTSPKSVITPDREDFIVVERLDALPRQDSVSDFPLIELDDSPPPSVGEPDSDGTVSLDGESNSQEHPSTNSHSEQDHHSQPTEDTTSGVQVQNGQEDEDDDIMIIEVRRGGFSVTNAQKNTENSVEARPRGSANVITPEQKEPPAQVRPPSSAEVNTKQDAQNFAQVRPRRSCTVNTQVNAANPAPVQQRSSMVNTEQNAGNPVQVQPSGSSNVNVKTILQNGQNLAPVPPLRSSILIKQKCVTPVRPRSSSVKNNSLLMEILSAKARPRSSSVAHARRNPQASPQIRLRSSSVVPSGQNLADSPQVRPRSSSVVPSGQNLADSPQVLIRSSPAWNVPLQGSPEPQVRRRSSSSVVDNIEQNTKDSEKELEELSEPEEIDEEEEDTLIAEGPGKYRYGRCGVHLDFDKYVCRICYEVFVLPRGAEELKMHIQTAHKEAAPKFYRHVEETGPGDFLYRKKVTFKQVGSDFSCGVCRGILEKKYDVIKHILLVHRDLLLKEGVSCPPNDQINGENNPANSAPEETEDIKPDNVVLFENKNRRVTRLSSKEKPSNANASIQNTPEVSILDDETDKTAVEEDFMVVRKIGPNKYLYLEECPFSEKSGVVQCGLCDFQHRNTRNAQGFLFRHMREKHLDPKVLRETGNNTWIFKDCFEFKAVGHRFKCGICVVNQGTMARMLSHLLTNHKDILAKHADVNNSCESAAAAVTNPPDQASVPQQIESSDCRKISDEQATNEGDIPSASTTAVMNSERTVQKDSHQTLCSICGFIGSFFDFFRHMKSVHGSHGDQPSKMDMAPVTTPASAPGTVPVSNGESLAPGSDASATCVDQRHSMTTAASGASSNSDSHTENQDALLVANPLWSSVSVTCPSQTNTVETPDGISESTTPVIQVPAADNASSKFPCRICSLELPTFQEYGKHVRVHLGELAF